MISIAKYIVDDSGEVLDVLEDNQTLVTLSHGDLVVKQKARNYYKDTTKIKNRFVKVNYYALEKLLPESKMICSILPYIGYLDGILKYKNGIVIKTKHLSNIFECTDRQTARNVKRLMELDVIHRNKIENENVFIFNPWIASKGSKVSKFLYNEFCDSEWTKTAEEAESKLWGEYNEKS